MILSSFQVACDNAPDTVPHVTQPPGYDFLKVDWQWCETVIPPIRDDMKHCSSSAIGDTIATEDVCSTLTALHKWLDSLPLDPPLVEPGDFGRIDSIWVCREPVVAPPAGSTGESRARIAIYADVPDRPRLFWVTQDEETSQLRFGVAHR